MSDQQRDKMSAVALARELRKWAVQNRMFVTVGASAPFDQPLVTDVFSAAGVRAVTSVLQGRGITYIGVNEEENSVTIYLQKKPRIRDLEMFSRFTKYGVPIHLAGGGLATAGQLPTPAKVAPSVYRKGAYTCGSSVYLSTEKGAGTFGCILSDGVKLYGLSANHVTGGSNYAELTLPIQAPGQSDILAGQPDPFTIGHHFGIMPFIDGLPNVVDCSGNLDAAVFLISDPEAVSSYQRDSFDTPPRVGRLRAGMKVMKAGRTTGLTAGDVENQLVDPYPVMIEIDFVQGKKLVYFEDLFVIGNDTTPFALSGDSGSLIVSADRDDDKVALGMVVATDQEGKTLALSLDRIISFFGMEIVSGHNI